MGLVQKRQLLSEISPPIDHLLATQLVDEFVSAERRFIQRDWEPAELDGGQFAEIAGRIWYAADSGNLNRNKDLSDCLAYIENEGNAHAISPRRTALHVARVLKTIYKFRSQRGAVHISDTYSPNHMDAKLIVENVRWLMNETLRHFWNGDREEVAKAIREILQFDVPAIGKFGDRLMVQRTDLKPEEEILVALHYAGEDGFNRTELSKILMCKSGSISYALNKLTSSQVRQVVLLDSGKFRLTDLGSKRIREELASKLLTQ